MKKPFAILFAFLAAASACRAAEPYHFLKEIPVSGEGGWDYLTVDSASHLLYVSHATKMVVIDLATDTVAGEIPNTPGIHGIALAPKLNRGFTSNGKENKVSIIDLKTRQLISQVETGPNPDAILFEPGREEVYAFNGRGKSATVFAAATGSIITTIPMGGKPEFAQADSEAGRVFNNLEDKNEVAVIDTRTHQIASRWPIAPGEEASGMAFDAAHHRLFLGCGNQKMVVMDSTNGKVVATVPIGDGVDANAFDPATQLAFASCGDGTTTIVHEDSPDAYTVVQTLATARGSRTMTLDPETHKIYLASATFEPAPKAEPGAPRQRPKMIAGSFKILVYGMGGH